MSNSSTMENTISSLVSRGSSSSTAAAVAAPAHSNLSLNLVIQYIDKVLSAITNKDVLDSGIKLRDLVQHTSSDLSKLLQGISEGAKMLSNQKFMTTKLSTEAQTVALDVLRGVGNAHWAAVGLLVIANVLDRFDKISANDRECIDLLRAMLNLGKYMKQLKDNHFDLHREILEKMTEGVQLIVSGAILCHSFIGSNKISKFLLTTKIREELVYVRGRVDSMKSDMVLQMQVLIMSTLTFYISTHHGQHGMLSHHDQRDTGEIQQGSETESEAEIEMYGLKSEASSSNRQDNYNEVNGHRQPKRAPPTFLSAGRFLRRILPQIFRRRLKNSSPDDMGGCADGDGGLSVKNSLPYLMGGSGCAECELSVKEIQPSAIEFTRKEVQNATKGFREKLGKGGFGTVYFGTLLDGRKVAVKLIATKGEGGREYQKEWWEKKLAALTRKHHPNVVKLVGYCFKGDLTLVYEYMAGGNLSDLLLQGESQQITDWHTRMKIIYDIIEGLVHLHEGAGGCVVHRDIKPINILLDENFNAKIADFGISYILTDDTQYAHEETWTESGMPPPQYSLPQYFEEETHVSTGLAGTLGYIDPEYMMSGKLTKKADIYSFGILLLNIVSGKNSILQTDEGLDRLEDHAWRLYKEDRLNELIDPRLVLAKSNLSEILRTTKIAMWCIQRESKVRPSAFQVLHMFSSEEKIPTAPVPIEYYLE